MSDWIDALPKLGPWLAFILKVWGWIRNAGRWIMGLFRKRAKPEFTIRDQATALVLILDRIEKTTGDCGIYPFERTVQIVAEELAFQRPIFEDAADIHMRSAFANLNAIHKSMHEALEDGIVSNSDEAAMLKLKILKTEASNLASSVRSRWLS
jgi:hypothetical protein